LSAKSAQADVEDLVTNDELFIAAVAMKHHLCFVHLITSFQIQLIQNEAFHKGGQKKRIILYISISIFYHFCTDSVLHDMCNVKYFFAIRRKKQKTPHEMW